MSITINRSIDIEDAVRTALSDYLTVFCVPLPEDYTLPNILVQSTGGTTQATAAGKGKVDTFTVVLDSRAETEAEAMEYLRNAVGILETVRGAYAYTAVNSLYSWGTDPVRPDLKMCSATLLVTAHRETVTI